MWPILLLLLVSCAAPVHEISNITQDTSADDIPTLENEPPAVEPEEPKFVNLSRAIPNQTVFEGWLMVQDSAKDIDGWDEEARSVAGERGFISGHRRAYQSGGPTDGQVVQFSLSQYSREGAIDAVSDLAAEAEGEYVINGNMLTREKNQLDMDQSIFYTETETIDGLGIVKRHFLAFARDGVYAKLICGGIDTEKSLDNCK